MRYNSPAFVLSGVSQRRLHVVVGWCLVAVAVALGEPYPGMEHETIRTSVIVRDF